MIVQSSAGRHGVDMGGGKVNNLETAKQMAAEIRLTRSEVNRLEAAAEDLLTDLKRSFLDDDASDDDLRAFVVLQTVLRGSESYVSR